MAVFLKILLILALVVIGLFVLTFLVYIFNLDMKLTAKLEPILQEMRDMGGFCDCEVLLNCYERYEIE